jgi:DNA polymerase III delta prime subunit
MTNISEFAWIDKYRPKEVEELIATDKMKNTVRKILERGKIPDMLFVGKPGVGKTAIAKLLCDKLGLDSFLVNASLKGNIDTLRNEISQFAGTVSLSGNGKCTILDEADYLNAQSTQPALRNFIDTYRENCSFVLTANYLNRLIEPLRERLEVHEFKVTPADLPSLVMQMTRRCEDILQLEKVEYDKRCLAMFIAGKAPNWRKIIIDLQRYARDNGKIDNGILGQQGATSVETLVPFLKEKNFAEIRKWVAENADTASQELFTDIVSGIEPFVIPQTLPALYMIAARYQYQSAFVANQQINFAAAFAEIMTECVFT